MKKFFIPALLLILILISCNKEKISFQTTQFQVDIDKTGNIVNFTDLNSGTSYFPRGEKAPVLSLYKEKEKEQILPSSALFNAESSKLILNYPNGSVAGIKVDNKGEYLRFELLSLEPRNGITIVMWGPYPTTIDKLIGETIGVVRDNNFAIGVQGLNILTIAAYPNETDSEEGRQYIDPLPGQELPDSLKDKIGEDFPVNVNIYGDMPAFVRQTRGTTAVKKSFGSEIRMYARDRRVQRIVDDGRWIIEPIDVDFIGTAIAVFGCKEPQTLDFIEKIELGENLPHPIFEGEWIKRSPRLNEAYMMMETNNHNIEKTIEYANACNFKLVHMDIPFRSWGHFDMKTNSFPKGAEDVRKMTARAAEEGIIFGAHTLTMFTQKHDPYISPFPNDSLCHYGITKLSQPVGKTDEVIYIDDPAVFKDPDKRPSITGNTHTVKIGKELVNFSNVSEDEPWRLLDCQRGRYNTTSASHEKGVSIEMLINDSYSGFYPDIYLQGQYSKRLAEICNNTGIGHMEFDGYAGGSATGQGAYAAGKFIKEWYENLDQYVLTGAAGPFHYFWHIYTRMNWGEPWYNNLRQSQVNYRLENQRYYKRNLMPCMMGWFSMQKNYRPEDIEWIQARSAGFDAGYLLRVDENTVESNGFKETHFTAIREWQKARKNNAFNEDQKERMKNPENEFHLEKVNDNEWKLYSVNLKGNYVHKFRLVQDGEPVVSNCNFQNQYESQPLQFYFYVKQGEESKNGTVSNIKLTVNNYAELLIPGEFQPNDNLYCDGEKIYLCDNCWKIKQTIPVGKLPKVKNGENQISILSDFKGNKPLIEMEFKTLSQPEVVKGK